MWFLRFWASPKPAGRTPGKTPSRMEGNAGHTWNFFSLREMSVLLKKSRNGLNQAHPEYVGEFPLLKVNWLIASVRSTKYVNSICLD